MARINLVALGIRLLEDQSQSRRAQIGRKQPVYGRQRPLHQHPFDPHMVEEVLYIPSPWLRTTQMTMQTGSGMGRNRPVEYLGGRRSQTESRYTAAPRRIDLNYVHSVCFQHPPEVYRLVPVFPRRNVHPGWAARRQHPQPFEIV